MIDGDQMAPVGCTCELEPRLAPYQRPQAEPLPVSCAARLKNRLYNEQSVYVSSWLLPPRCSEGLAAFLAWRALSHVAYDACPRPAPCRAGSGDWQQYGTRAIFNDIRIR
jgi:hypothetical protein